MGTWDKEIEGVSQRFGRKARGGRGKERGRKEEGREKKREGRDGARDEGDKR